jgi:hypothetical protein
LEENIFHNEKPLEIGLISAVYRDDDIIKLVKFAIKKM